MNKRATRWYLIVALVVVSTVLISCSSGGSSGSPSSSASSAPSSKASTGSSPSQSANKDPYKVGITSALTGPAASTYLPMTEGARIYFESLNAKGGIDGHPVQLMIEDDRADAGQAATNAQKFVSLGVQVMMNHSTSATYTPFIAEAKRANIPVVVSGAAPKEATPPEPDPLVFAASATAAANTDGPRFMYSANLLSKGSPIKASMVTVDIPTAVVISDRGLAVAKEFNAEGIMTKVPLGLVDYTPVASGIIAQGANWVTAIGPAVGPPTFAALDKLGYKGNFLDLYPTDLMDLAKLQKDNLYYSSASPPLDESRADHKEILDAAKAHGAVALTANTSTTGWAGARVVSEVLKRTGWPATTDKLLKTMNNFELSMGQLYPPFKWTSTDHQSPFYWRIYRWDKDKKAIVTATDWYRIDATGDTKSITKIGSQLP